MIIIYNNEMSQMVETILESFIYKYDKIGCHATIYVILNKEYSKIKH